MLRADDIQPADDPAVVMADSRETRIENATSDMLEALAALYSADVVQSLVARYDIQGLWNILSSPEAATALFAAYRPISDTFTDAADQESESAFGNVIVYDPLAAAAQLSARRQQFAAAITAQAKQVVQDQIIQSLRYGVPVELIADSLSQVIGLTPKQAQAVTNFRAMLMSGDSAVLQRALRDRRFDPTVRAMIAGDVNRDASRIEAMVDRYAQRMVAYRAETIARTEAMNAATGGIRDAYVQAVRSGRLYDHEVKRFWLTAGDERECPVCASIPRLNRSGVGVNEPYASTVGPVMTTGIHPRCRCSERYVANITRLTQQPFAMAA